MSAIRTVARWWVLASVNKDRFPEILVKDSSLKAGARAVRYRRFTSISLRPLGG